MTFRRRPERRVRKHVAPLVRHDLSRRHRTDDEEAIQTDAAAIGAADDSPFTAALEAAGTLVPLQTPLCSRCGFSPRSPRGPPRNG